MIHGDGVAGWTQLSLSPWLCSDVDSTGLVASEFGSGCFK